MAASRRVVAVTGASAGLGRAIALEFARDGADVALLARDPARLASARTEVEHLGRRALDLSVDVADPAAVDAAAERIEQELGPLDVWVNNAMATIFSPFERVSPEEFRRATEVTYLGFVWGTRSALRRMKPRNRGTIIQVGSALAYRAIPLQAPYCGAKHAMKGFTEAVRCELLHDGSAVELVMVHMPALNTPQFSWGRTHLPRHPQPVPPIFQPEVGARAVVEMSHHPRRESWVAWPTVEAITGEKAIPGLLDRYLSSRAWDGQMTDEPISTDRPGNLFEPVPGPYRAHGEFDRRARSVSWEAKVARHRGFLFALAGGALLGALGILAGFAGRRTGRSVPRDCA
jgi:NAD(P)-dependent dehydrogenase (short-subunit alcohol dehydrogenase family)